MATEPLLYRERKGGTLVTDTRNPLTGLPPLPRRTVLQGSALVALGGGALTGPGRGRPSPAGRRATGAGRATTAATSSSGVTALALPMLGDGMNMDRPEYYETLQAGRRAANHTAQSADVNGDGQDELVVRGPGGVLVYYFDPDSGQWWNLPGSPPAWSDATGWAHPQYYETIQTADIDGDGQAELLGFGPQGLEAWHYDTTARTWSKLPGATPVPAGELGEPWYYQTMQCADLDGDGTDELLVRTSEGMAVFAYDGATWTQVALNTGLSDADGLQQAHYYSTIQCADLDGDGKAELMVRGAAGLVAWRLEGAQWTPLPLLPNLSDANGWTGPAYYSTIQCADLDGDGAAEVVARGASGVLAWRYLPSGSGSWQRLTDGPAWSDAAGWDHAVYYSTMRCADLDGDGKAEVYARSSAAIDAYAFAGPGTGSWSPLPTGPTLSDAAGWDHVQYYGTIQPATVKGSAVNSNNPPPSQPGAVLLARSATAVETWRLHGGAWTRTTAPWPELDPTAYAAISTLLGIVAEGGIRTLYNDQLQNVNHYQMVLGTSPPPTPPSGYVGSIDAWYAAVAQIENELVWALNVRSWYANLHDLITQTYLSNDMSVQTVSTTIQLKQTQSTAALSVLSLLFNAAWAIAGVPEGGEVVAAIAGLMATASEAATTNWGGGDTISATVADLDQKLEDLFDAARTYADQKSVDITGGLVDDTVVPGDYGLLYGIGQQIESGVAAWDWTSDQTTALAIVGGRSYAISVWQALAPPADWRWSVNLDQPQYFDDPNQKAYRDLQWWWDKDDRQTKCSHYFMVQHETSIGFSSPVLIEEVVIDALSKPATADAIFPLGVLAADIVTAENGWPQVKSTFVGKSNSGCKDVVSPYGTSDDTATPDLKESTSPNPLPELGVDLTVHSELARDSQGEVYAVVRVKNFGLSAATNVRVETAKLRGRRPVGQLPTRHRRVDDGESAVFHVHFGRVPGKAGQKAQLQLTGRHAGGTFATKAQVVLP